MKILNEKGHEVRAMIRDASQAEEMRKLGSEPVVADLEKDKFFPLEGVDAVYFVAGSGAGTGEDKTKAVDEKGAIKLVEDAYRHKVQRFIMLSSVGADDPKKGPDELQPYLKAKHEADKELKYSGILYTVVRANNLSDEPGTGKVQAGEKLESYQCFSNHMPYRHTSSWNCQYHTIFSFIFSQLASKRSPCFFSILNHYNLI